MIPSWGLHQQFDVDDQPQQTVDESGAGTVRLMLVAAMVVLGVAAFAHVIRYGLLLINRNMLLHPLIAIGGVAIGLLASVVAIVVVLITVVVLVRWLIARRAAGYAQHGEVDPRSTRTPWLCCLLPGVNLVMAPVFVWELAALEGRLSHLRRPIVVWWIAWVFSAVLAVWSMAGTVYVTFFNDAPAEHRRQHGGHDRRVPARARRLPADGQGFRRFRGQRDDARSAASGAGSSSNLTPDPTPSRTRHRHRRGFAES